MLSHSDVIAAFGGVRPLAEAISVDPKRAIHWAQRGIPAKYWLLVEDVATTKGISITARRLMEISAGTPSAVQSQPSEAAEPQAAHAHPNGD